MSEEALRQNALDYHRRRPYGKIEIIPTKPLATQRDLALAYSPGVAAACEAIVENPQEASELTARGNLVAVISNGTAVLGLGDIGPLAAKPVMEGKSVLFKKFAGLDSIDIEIDEKDPDKLVDIISSLEPSFGGINLEDIKAPECFIVEEKLRKKMNIPVFHDDQHGTAIIVAAAFYNWVKLSKRKLKNIKLVCNGAGASALACLDLLVDMGLPLKNIYVCDRKGLVHTGRKDDMYPKKEKYAKDTNMRNLAEALVDADVFLGLSAPNTVKQDDIKNMAKKPLLMTLSNPVPEIMPELVKEVRPDATICTGRSDYPNQVNNVLCFPFIFRGALDVGATTINEEMKIACVKALAELTMAESTAEVAAVYGDTQLKFGPDYLIPKPFDPRLIVELPVAVARAAQESGVATRPISDFQAYRQQLEQYVFRSGNLMRPIYARAKENPKRICFAEGEESRVLRAAQVIVDEKLAHPILIGRRAVVESRIEKHGLRIKIGQDFELVDPEDDPRYQEYWSLYWNLMERKGMTKSMAKTVIRTNTTVIGSLMVERDEADALVCGTIGDYQRHKRDVLNVLGLRNGVSNLSSMSGLLIKKGTYFICDPYVTDNPDAEQIAEMTLLAADEIRKFGIVPRVALLSRSNFGSFDNENSLKMRKALRMIQETDPDLEIDGEMHADFALDVNSRSDFLMNSKLKGEANVLIMPNADAANITVNIIKTLGDGLVIGPLLLGIRKPAHIMTPMATTRGIINVAALANVAAQTRESEDTEKKLFRLLRL